MPALIVYCFAIVPASCWRSKLINPTGKMPVLHSSRQDDSPCHHKDDGDCLLCYGQSLNLLADDLRKETGYQQRGSKDKQRLRATDCLHERHREIDALQRGAQKGHRRHQRESFVAV
ncbi:MAG: hypothetical protein WCP55_18735 [Lentisphaerota bacterium]